MTTVADPFTSEVVSGIEQTANDHGYCVFLADSNADPDREKKIVQSFAEQRVDGIIVTSSRVGALYLPLLSEMMVPIVLVNDQYPGAFVHSVMICNQEGSREIAEHLIGSRSSAHRLYRRPVRLSVGHGAPCRLQERRWMRRRFRSLPELVVRGDGKPEAAMRAMDELAGAESILRQRFAAITI